MSVKAKDLIRLVEEIAPEESQESWDNSGLQIGDRERTVKGVLLAMDISDKSVDYAIDNNLNFILAHHPFFFGDIRSIDYSSYKGQLIKKIIKNDIFIYSAHTNLDASSYGVNFELAKRIGLINIKKFSEYIEGMGIGVLGQLDDLEFEEFLKSLEILVDRNYIRLYGRKKERINKVAVVGGSGTFALDLAKNLGVDTVVTGDVKYHDGQKAYENDLLLVDIGHFHSEFPILSVIKDIFIDKYEDLVIDTFKNPVYLIKINNK